MTANRLRRMYDQDDLAITVVDENDRHVYQPGLLFVPFGLSHPEDIVRARHRQLHDGIAFRESAIDHVDIVDKTRVDVAYLEVQPTGRLSTAFSTTGPYLLVRVPRVGSVVTFSKPPK